MKIDSLRREVFFVTDTIRLDSIIKASGYKFSFIANQLGLSDYGFARKRNNLSDFTSSEINKLCDILHIDSIEDRFAIFFAQKVDGKSTKETI